MRAGPFTVIVGANASGKSNIRDAFRFLHGIGRGYTLAEIAGGKYGAGGQVEWDGIRGAANEIIRIFPPSLPDIPSPPMPGFGLEVELTVKSEEVTYSVEVSREITRTKGLLGYGIQDHGIQDHIRTTADRRRGGLREAEESIRRTPSFPWEWRQHQYQARQTGSDPSSR